jgi:hypothetical protein
MDEKNDDQPIKQVPIRELKVEPEAEDLIASPAMEPYFKLALAVMGHKDARPAVKEISALPLQKRYTWRVVSALKWAFADFENLNVVADRRTLSQNDLDTVVDLLRVRPLQFCLFLTALFGEDRMEKMMSSSIQQVKTLRANRRKSLGRELESSEE